MIGISGASRKEGRLVTYLMICIILKNLGRVLYIFIVNSNSRLGALAFTILFNSVHLLVSYLPSMLMHKLELVTNICLSIQVCYLNASISNLYSFCLNVLTV
ncbi:hypothetical protein M758_5G077100 [Ceratodon purpureus]|nr:hypothetical protein M758_5G077100 [Ceratodon purpureus]